MTPFYVSNLLRQTVLMTTPLSEVIFEWPNTPRPVTPYASVGIITTIQVGWGEYHDTNADDGDLDRWHDTLYNVFIGVNFYRPDSMLNASLFSKGLIRQDVIELWNNEGISLVDRSDTRDLTKVFDSQFEDRAQMDVTMQALITEPYEKVMGVNEVRISG